MKFVDDDDDDDDDDSLTTWQDRYSVDEWILLTSSQQNVLSANWFVSETSSCLTGCEAIVMELSDQSVGNPRR